MPIPAFEALLLLVLVIPVIMRYRILPINGTPYWLFGVLFLLLIVNLWLALFPWDIKINRIITKIKTIFLWLILVIVIGGTGITSISDRNKTAPIYGVHDIILQQEAAMRYLIQGKNPYRESYFGTPLEQWHYDELGKPAVNPALHHFVMPPWYLLFPFAFYFISLPTLGFFDGRLMLFFSLFALLIIVWRWFRQRQLGTIAIILLSLAPGTVDYFLEGRSDIFALFWLIWSLYLLDSKKLIWSGIIFGLALASKQTVWLAIPFYLVYLWYQSDKSKTKLFFVLIAMTLTLIFLIGPFLWWDASAFLNSVVFYLSGNTRNAYPISGYGLGMVLYNFGMIKDVHEFYPFVWWQILLGVPILAGLLRWLTKRLLISRLLLGYGFFLFIIWYLSRYFNNSHLSYIGSVLTLGVLKMSEENRHETKHFK